MGGGGAKWGRRLNGGLNGRGAKWEGAKWGGG